LLYIGNIPKHLTQEQAQKYISDIAKVEIKKFELVLNNDEKSKGYGWITTENHQKAIIALKNLETTPIEGSYLAVAFAEPRTVDERILYVERKTFTFFFL